MGSSQPESWTDEEWAEWAWENLDSPMPKGLSAEDADFYVTIWEHTTDDGIMQLSMMTQADSHWKFAKLSKEWKLRYYRIIEQGRRDAAVDEADRHFAWLTPGMKRALGGATVVVVLASGITYAVTRDGARPVDEPTATQPAPSPAPAAAAPADESTDQTDEADEADEAVTAPSTAATAEPDTAESDTAESDTAEPDTSEPETAEPDGPDEATADPVPRGWDDVGDNGSSGRPPAAGGEGADARLFEVFIGSTVFELTVEGDGQTMSTAPTTLWYNPRFIVNNDPATNFYDDDSGFSVDVGWNRDGEPETDVRDAQNELMPEVAVDVAWVTPSVLRVVVDRPDGDVPVTRARLELSVRTQDDAGNTVATFEDTALWEPEN